ncbi:MAG: polysaccharide deacetylase family protein [Anaerolineales bacterium]|nr:polysaccharide deacetylase family protein [Anaerolineales bacterium]
MNFHPPKKIINFILCAFLLLGCRANASTSAPQPATPTKQSLSYFNTTVSLTFDDGDADNYLIRETLKANNLRATFYVISGKLGQDGFLTEAQVKDLYADGNEIGGHTLNHTKLVNLSVEELRKEICQDRLNLLSYGFKATSFAYPYGYHDAQVRQVVQDCGYNSARTVADGPESLPPAAPFALKAMPFIVQDTTFSKMMRYVRDVEAGGGGWAIFIFHHVCAGCDQYAVEYETFVKFAEWLGQQQTNNGLTIKTVDEALGGELQPGVAP